MLNLTKYTLQIKILKTSETPNKWDLVHRQQDYFQLLQCSFAYGWKHCPDERLLKDAYKAETNSQHFWEMVVESRYSGLTPAEKALTKKRFQK